MHQFNMNTYADCAPENETSLIIMKMYLVAFIYTWLYFFMHCYEHNCR